MRRAGHYHAGVSNATPQRRSTVDASAWHARRHGLLTDRPAHLFPPILFKAAGRLVRIDGNGQSGLRGGHWTPCGVRHIFI
jgi:hypothetical protein